MRQQKQKGFTLIELLVVISIIGLMASVLMVALSNARLKARDAKRVADLHQINLALALYYNTYGTYPLQKSRKDFCGGTDGDTWAGSNGTCGGQWLTADANFIQIMPKVPVDQLNSGANAGWGDGQYVYSYVQENNGQDYDLLTQLEDPSNPNRCATREAYYHSTPPQPWCAPWPGNLSRSQNIYTDH